MGAQPPVRRSGGSEVAPLVEVVRRQLVPAVEPGQEERQHALRHVGRHDRRRYPDGVRVERLTGAVVRWRVQEVADDRDVGAVGQRRQPPAPAGVDVRAVELAADVRRAGDRDLHLLMHEDAVPAARESAAKDAEAVLVEARRGRGEPQGACPVEPREASRGAVLPEVARWTPGPGVVDILGSKRGESVLARTLGHARTLPARGFPGDGMVTLSPI